MLRDKCAENKELLFSLIKATVILIAATFFIDVLNVDQIVADRIYQWEGYSWELKNAWFTSVFIHFGGKYFSIFLIIVVLFFLLASFVLPPLRGWRLRLTYLFIAAVLGSLSVSIGKTISNISCPWDFSRYGGTLEYISLIEQLRVRNGSQCFPAGHASAGFAWVALYFVGLHSNSSWRWPALFFSLFLGVLFGVSQQLRGAHFLSHDLWSFGCCWMVSLVCYYLILNPYESLKQS